MMIIAYVDDKCVYGYMTLCELCKKDAPRHVHTDQPIVNPPTLGKKISCEICKKVGVLVNPKENERDSHQQ